MVIDKLTSINNRLKEIRTNLVKAGPERRKGDNCREKFEEANEIYEKFSNIFKEVKVKLETDKVDNLEEIQVIADSIKKEYAAVH